MSDLNFASAKPFLLQDLMNSWDGKLKTDEFGREYVDINWDGVDTDDIRASLDEHHVPKWTIAIMHELDARYDGE